MEAIVIQPPSPHPVVLDQAGGRAQHMAPPWDSLCLLSYLRQRTRHTGRVFDARVRANWREDLARNLAVNEPAQIALIQCGHHDADAVDVIVQELLKLHPTIAMAGFGAMPTTDPAAFLARYGMHFAVVGDPEPTLRHVMDNFHIAARRQRIPALLQEGEHFADPLWVNDLKTLAHPDWRDVSFAYYESRAYVGGSIGGGRVDMRMSRGCGSHPLQNLLPTSRSPLRIGPMDRFADVFQECAHIGISEVRFIDSPDVWNSELLDAWLMRLARINNVQDWSLRLLAMPLGESFRNRLLDLHCRRIELLVPSCDPEIAEQLRYDPPHAADMAEMLHWFKQHGMAADFVFWAGGANEPAGEAGRILRFIKNLRYPPFSVEARPDVPPGDPRLAAIARTVGRRISISPGRRIRGLFSRVKNIRVTIDHEHRELVVRPRGIPQAITGDTQFQSLEPTEGQNSNEQKK